MAELVEAAAPLPAEQCRSRCTMGG